MIPPVVLKWRLSDDKKLTVLDSDMNPDNPEKHGQGLFLVRINKDTEDVVEKYQNAGFAVEGGEKTDKPNEFYIAIPPESE